MSVFPCLYLCVQREVINISEILSDIKVLYLKLHANKAAPVQTVVVKVLIRM